MEKTGPYSIYLDDERVCPWTKGDWETVRSFDGFVNLIRWRGPPQFISFDHDLSEEHYEHLDHPIPYEVYREKTGYHAAQWLKEHCQANGLALPRWAVHSRNEAGKENIERILTPIPHSG